MAEFLFGVGAIHSILQNPMLQPFEPIHYFILTMYFHWLQRIPPLIVISVLFDMDQCNASWTHTNKLITSTIMRLWAKIVGI